MTGQDQAAAKCPPSIPAWVMTFADLMSLLLAFFVLLFSFSEMDKNIYKELAGSLKEAFGVQREIKAKETPRGINIIAREFSPGRPVPTALNEVRQMTTDESKSHPVFTDPAKKGQENQDKKSDDAEDKSFNAIKEDIDGKKPTKALPTEAVSVTSDKEAVSAAAKKEPDSVKQDKETVSVTVDKKEFDMMKRIKTDSQRIRKTLKKEIKQGLIDMKITQKRIILMVREKGSFPSGSAQLIEPFKIVVSKISSVFSDFDGVIIVSGHTDNIPINTYRFRSNWELSSSRAVSVIHELLKDKALKSKQFEIAAFADTKPVDLNTTAAGRAKNRRVEIMMDYSKIPYDKVKILNNAELVNPSQGKRSNHEENKKVSK